MLWRKEGNAPALGDQVRPRPVNELSIQPGEDSVDYLQPYNSNPAEICWIVAAVFTSLLGPRNQNEPSGVPPRGMLNSFKFNLNAPFASRIQGFQAHFDTLGGGLSMTGTSERTTLGNKLGHNLCGCQHSVSRLSR